MTDPYTYGLQLNNRHIILIQNFMIKCNIMMFNHKQICLELVAAASNTTSPLRRHSWFILLMHTLLESTLALMVSKHIWLHAVVWPALHPWNQFNMLTPKTLHQPSWKSNCAMGSAIPLSLTKTASSMVFVVKPWTYWTSTATSFLVITITPWWLSMLIDTSQKAWR